MSVRTILWISQIFNRYVYAATVNAYAVLFTVSRICDQILARPVAEYPQSVPTCGIFIGGRNYRVLRTEWYHLWMCLRAISNVDVHHASNIRGDMGVEDIGLYGYVEHFARTIVSGNCVSAFGVVHPTLVRIHRSYL